MAEMMENGILIRDVETKNIMTKSNLPVGGYSVNPYVGCAHGCKYCYASFMKRFTGHTEPWGTFLDIKHWPEIKNPPKYRGQRVVIGSVTDGYLPQEEQFQNTRKLLEQLKDSGAEILICTKSDLVVRDIDLLREMGKVTVSWSINTLDEDFRRDMDKAVSIEQRLDAMKRVYDAGIRTVCFIAPVFPGRVWNFSKKETVIAFQFAQPEETDARATKILITPTWHIEGSVAKVEACNNAFDASPAWEDITAQVAINRVYNFLNQSKTAEKWGVNVRFTIEKNEGYEGEVSISGFGGAYK